MMLQLFLQAIPRWVGSSKNPQLYGFPALSNEYIYINNLSLSLSLFLYPFSMNKE